MVTPFSLPFLENIINFMEEKIYITSDIHSDIEALKFIINLASQDNASLLLIAGDLVPSSLEFTQVLQSAPLRYVCVKICLRKRKLR